MMTMTTMMMTTRKGEVDIVDVALGPRPRYMSLLRNRQ